MHTNRFFSARKFLFSLGAALSLLLLAGCDGIVLTNLTPPSLRENASQIYTITLRVTPKVDAIQRPSIAPHIVIDGQNFAMNKASLGEGIYEFDYQLPPGRDELAYYFLVNYMIVNNGIASPAEAYTEITRSKIERRYVLSLESNRGPVGARIGVVGRGFTPQDVISLDGNPVRTVFESSNSLSFFVPALAAGRNYQVAIASPSGNSSVGTFRIDGSSLSVSPTSLTLRTGETQTITFTIPNPAPPGGLLLDLTTDVPESVIMPEILVPQGQTTVTVNVQGGRPGNGSLFLKGYGAGEITVPITVTAK